MKVKNEKIIFQGKMIEVVHEIVSIDNKEVIYEKGRRAPGTRLIIETPDGGFLISKEERPGTGLDYRLPGGKVFDSLLEYNEFLSVGRKPEEIYESTGGSYQRGDRRSWDKTH